MVIWSPFVTFPATFAQAKSIRKLAGKLLFTPISTPIPIAFSPKEPTEYENIPKPAFHNACTSIWLHLCSAAALQQLLGLLCLCSTMWATGTPIQQELLPFISTCSAPQQPFICPPAYLQAAQDLQIPASFPIDLIYWQLAISYEEVNNPQSSFNAATRGVGLQSLNYVVTWCVLFLHCLAVEILDPVIVIKWGLPLCIFWSARTRMTANSASSSEPCWDGFQR